MLLQRLLLQPIGDGNIFRVIVRYISKIHIIKYNNKLKRKRIYQATR